MKKILTALTLTCTLAAFGQVDIDVSGNRDTELLNYSAATIAAVYTVDKVIDWVRMTPKVESGTEVVIFELLTEEEVKATGQAHAAMRVMTNTDHLAQDIFNNIHVTVWIMEGKRWNYHFERLWNLDTQEMIYSLVKIRN